MHSQSDLTPKSFLHLLVWASIVPYLIVLICGYSRQWGGSLNLFEQLLIGVAFLNLVHVPATLYLYFDRDIQKQAKSAPFSLIYMPLLFIIGGSAVFLFIATYNAIWTKYLLVIYLLGFVHWNAWHAGKQSYGVHSFAAIITGRNKRTAEQRAFERNTIVWGTVFGMCSIYGVMPSHWWVKNFPDVNYMYFNMVGSAAYYIGMAGCFAVAFLAIRYVIKERASFTFSSGALYLIGALFFLPSYLTAIIPDITPPEALVTMINLQVVHGVQYMVFMLVHAAGRGEDNAVRIADKPVNQFVARLLPVLLLMIVAVGGGISLSRGMLVQGVSTWLTGLFQVKNPQLWIGTIVVGFPLGLQMAHFWVDSFIWRLSEPGPRTWMMSRYRQVLPARA